MKKVIKSYYERLQPVLLFFEDIKELYEIFQEASSQITIQSNGYEFDNLDDLTKLKKEIVYDIEILCLEPYISLKMEPRNIHLYVAEDSLSSRGVFEKLKSILNNRRKKLTWLTHSPIPPGILMGSAILYFPLFDLLKNPYYNWAAGILVLATYVIWNVWNHRNAFKRYSIVHLKYRSEASLWHRKKDEIVVGAILALLTGIVGVVVKTF